MADPVAGLELFQARCLYAKQRVSLTAENADFLRVQRLVVQGRQWAAEVGNGDIQLPIYHRQLEFDRRVHEDVQVHVVLTLIKPCDGCIDP